MHVVTDTAELYHAQWFSWGEWVDHCSKRSPAAKDYGTWTPQPYFTGIASLEAALKLATEGWIEGADRISVLAQPITDRIMSLVSAPVYSYDVEGSMLDIGTYLSGDPECFLRQSEEIKDGFSKHLRVVFDIGQRGDVSKEAMISRGAVVVALVECLERAGRRVELWGGNCSNFSPNALAELFVRVKKAEDPVDLPALAFAIGHPASFRHLVFSAMEHMPRILTGQWSLGGYGSTRYGHTSTLLPSDVAIEGLFDGDPTKQIMAMLRKQGIEIEA